MAIQNVLDEDSEQYAKMHRLLLIIAGCTYAKVCFLMLLLLMLHLHVSKMCTSPFDNQSWR